MKIKWLDDAVNDLKELRHYIAQDKPGAASQVAKKIIYGVNYLAKHPQIGRVGRIHNTRELIISNFPYIIPYRVKNNVIEILRVLHAAMQWPNEL